MKAILMEFKGEEIYFFSKLCEMYSISQSDMQLFLEPSTFVDSSPNYHDQPNEVEDDSDEYSTVISLFSTGSPRSNNDCDDDFHEINRNGDNNYLDYNENNNTDDCNSYHCDDDADQDVCSTRSISHPFEYNTQLSASVSAQMPWSCVLKELVQINSSGFDDSNSLSSSGENGLGDLFLEDRNREKYRAKDRGTECKIETNDYDNFGFSDYHEAFNGHTATSMYLARAHALEPTHTQRCSTNRQCSNNKNVAEERRLKMKACRDRFLALDGDSVDGSRVDSFGQYATGVIDQDKDHESETYRDEGCASEGCGEIGRDTDVGEDTARGFHQQSVKCNESLKYDDRLTDSFPHPPPPPELSCDRLLSPSNLLTSPCSSIVTVATDTTATTLSLSQMEQRPIAALDICTDWTYGPGSPLEVKQRQRLTQKKHQIVLDKPASNTSVYESGVSGISSCDSVSSSHPSMGALYPRYSKGGSTCVSTSRYSRDGSKSSSNPLGSYQSKAILHDPKIREKLFNNSDLHSHLDSGPKVTVQREDSYDYLIDDTEQWQREMREQRQRQELEVVHREKQEEGNLLVSILPIQYCSIEPSVTQYMADTLSSLQRSNYPQSGGVASASPGMYGVSGWGT